MFDFLLCCCGFFTCCPKTHYLSQNVAIPFAMLIYLVYLTYCKICDPLYKYKDTDLASLTFPLGKHNMHIPVQPESHLRDFSALVLCTFGLCGMFLLTYE